jgi:hypothetical protein
VTDAILISGFAACGVFGRVSVQVFDLQLSADCCVCVFVCVLRHSYKIANMEQNSAGKYLLPSSCAVPMSAEQSFSFASSSIGSSGSGGATMELAASPSSSLSSGVAAVSSSAEKSYAFATKMAAWGMSLALPSNANSNGNSSSNCKVMASNSALGKLSTDLVTAVVSFLWVQDVVSFQSCNKTYYELVAHGKVFQRILRLCLQKTGRVVNDDAITGCYRALTLLKCLSPFPYGVDYRSIFRNKRFKLHQTSPGQFDRITYTGRLGSNNVVFGNDHFPLLPIDKKLRKFTKTCVVNNKCVPFLSLVAYFEIEVEARNALGTSMDEDEVDPCIAVGIATLRFPTNGMMPGWDENSYGFHGDDGHFFHGRSFGQPFARSKLEYEFLAGASDTQSVGSTTSSSSSSTNDDGHRNTTFSCRFGPGDTVGCGIVYPPLTSHSFPEVFYTLNGRFLGKKRIYVPLQLPFFPVVGCDCYNSFRFNYNNSDQCKPFKFDVVKYERYRVANNPNSELLRRAYITDHSYFDDPANPNELNAIRRDRGFSVSFDRYSSIDIGHVLWIVL